MRRTPPLPLALALLLVGWFVASHGFANSPPDLSRSGDHSVGDEPHRQKLLGDITVEASPGSRIVVLGKVKVPVRPNRPATTCHSFKIESGRMTISVPKGNPPSTSVLIRTPHRVSFVSLGGSAEVVVEEKETTIAIRQGSALVASGNDWKEMRAGRVRSLSKTGITADRAIVGVPSAQARPALVVAPKGGTGTATLDLTLPQGAKQLEVEMERLSGNTRTVVHRAAVRGKEASVPGLVPGSYQARVRAVDASGIAGRSAQTNIVRVMAFEIPKGAVVRGDTIWLLPGQRVKLIEAKGLELTYGAKNPYFVKAPRDIGIVSRKRTVARLRAQGSTRETKIILEPRPNTAEIQVGPPGARWPDDLLEVELTLLNARGMPDPGAPVKKQVSVNGREVEVKWQIQGAHQRAILEPLGDSGPWRVRIVVADDLGTIAEKQVHIAEPKRSKRSSSNATSP